MKYKNGVKKKMIEHVIFKIGNFQKEMKEDMLLEKTFQDKNQRKE